MARIAIDIDTQDQQSGSTTAVKRLASSKNLGILSTITLDTNFISAIEAGYGAAHHKHSDNLGYSSSLIQSAYSDLKGKYGCDFVAAVGGLAVHSAISSVSSSTNPLPFVSLVGATPSGIGPGQTCCGGISLESWPANKDRIQILLKKLGLSSYANIALYANSSSTMATSEAADWKLQVGSSTNIYNSSGNYGTDFNGSGNTPSLIPSTIQGIVISADPTFQSNKNTLVAAANTWVTAANTSRYIVYPFILYNQATQLPASNKSTLFGPDLYQAYYELGQLAQIASSTPGTYFGFDSVRNLRFDF